MNTIETNKKLCDIALMTNVTSLVFNVIRDVCGNDISSTVNGSRLTKNLLRGMLDSALQEKLGSSDNGYRTLSGSMLDRLVEATIPLIYKIDTNNEDLEELTSMVNANIEESARNNGAHCMLMSKYTKMLSEAVKAHVKIARTVVLPIVKNDTDKAIEIIAGIDTDIVRNGSSSVNIVMCERPALASNDDLLEVIGKYKGNQLVLPDLLTLGNVDYNEILMYSTMGASTIDDEILMYLKSRDEETLHNAYSMFFNAGSTDYTVENMVKTDAYNVFYYALVGFLYSRRLFDHIPENLQMSLKDYNSSVADIRDYCGTLLLNAIELMNSYDRTDTVIVHTNQEKREVIVNGPLYKRWVKENDEKAILAALVSDRPRATVALLDLHKDSLIKDWDDYIAYATVRDAKTKHKNIKYMLSMNAYITDSDITDIERNYMSTCENHIAKVKKLSDAYIDGLSEKDLEDIDTVILTLVTKCRFYFTASYCILSNIERLTRINENMGPREAALLAVLEYVLNYLLSQIKIDDNTVLVTGTIAKPVVVNTETELVATA